ncbi:MAG: MarR family transcriptional regulator, partial [Rhodospirillales bacterium]
MENKNQHRIRDLIERIARLNSADEWTDDLNPTQWSALSYLSQANRFSRSPSQVAEFMAATRGTVSQTLKALARKELIIEIRSQIDRRWISYDVTTKGMNILDGPKTIDDALDNIGSSARAPLADGLENLLREALRLR